MASSSHKSGQRNQPLICGGHLRPILDISFSPGLDADDGVFIISAGKDGSPQLRDGVTGDWIGTFTGHKGPFVSRAVCAMLRVYRVAVCVMCGGVGWMCGILDPVLSLILFDLPPLPTLP